MRTSKLIHWRGLAAVLGGILWIIYAIVVAQMPVGCIADECNMRPMRDTGAAAPLFILAVLLIGLGVTALVSRARATGRFSMLGRGGLIAVSAGMLILMLALLVQSFLFRDDFPLMPYFVIPAGLALVVGFLLLGIAILRSGVLPRWTAALLIIGTLVLLAINDQNERILLAIPFGMAWIAIGYVLWSDSAGTHIQRKNQLNDIPR